MTAETTTALSPPPATPAEGPAVLNQWLGIPPVPWCVCRTLPRREMVLAEILRHEYPDIPFLLPRILVRNHKPASASRTAARLLFPGMIFIGASVRTLAAPAIPYACFLPENPPPTAADRDRMLLDPTLDVIVSTRQVSNFLFTGLQARLRRELLLLAEAPPTLRPDETPTAGTLVRVRSGPLMGMEGLVEPSRQPPAECTNIRVHIRLVLLGQPLSVELDANLLEKM